MYSKVIHRMGQGLVIALAISLPLSIAAANVLMGALALVWVIGGNWSVKCRMAAQDPFVQLMLGIVSLYLLGGLLTQSNSDLIEGLRDAVKLLLPFVCAPFIQNERTRRYAIVGFCAAVMVAVGAGALKFYFDLPWGMKYTQAAVFMNHIKTSFVAMMAILILSHYGITLKRWIFVIPVAGLLFYVIALSYSRMGYVLAACYCLWLLSLANVVSRKWCITLGLSFVALFSAILLFSSTFTMRLLKLWDEARWYTPGAGNTSFGERFDYLVGSWELVQRTPWMGVGTGGFSRAFHVYAEPLRFQLTQNPHNQYLLYWVEWGTLGILVISGLWIKMFSQLPSDGRTKLFQGITAIFFIGMFFNSWLSDCNEGMVFVLMSTLILGGAYKATDTTASELQFREV